VSEISRAKRVVPSTQPVRRVPGKKKRRRDDEESNSDEESPFDDVADVAEVGTETNEEPASPKPIPRRDDDGEHSIDVVA